MSDDPFKRAALDWSAQQASCEVHGEYLARRFRTFEPSGCPVCSAERQALERARAAEADRLAEQRARVQAIGLRGWLCDATFDTFVAETEKQRGVLSAAKAFADGVAPDTAGGLFLIGPPGVGKSHLGAAIAQAVVVQRGFTARMVTCRGIVRELRSTWRRDATQEEEDVIERLATVDLLVLDEIGIGFGSEAEATQLFEVIDRRSQHRHPVVVLSNLNHADLKAAVGERAYDRLRHNATSKTLNWPSYRAPAA